jgi:predicted Zn-dependent protease
MRQILGAALLALLCVRLAAAQPLLEFRDDLAFSAAEVDGLAARSFGARLRTLARAGKLDTEPLLKARLQTIVPRLIRAAVYERPAAARLQWEIHSCSRCDENASAMAGGKLLISSDLVARLALSDDELAYLLAHEIAHVIAEHTREFASAARYFVDNGLARNYADIEHELAESYAVMIRMQPLYVEQELSADYIGFFLGARAGFTPEAMLGLLRKLNGSSPALVATHPSDARRMRQAETMFESARRLYASASPEGRRNAWLASVGLLPASVPGPL